MATLSLFHCACSLFHTTSTFIDVTRRVFLLCFPMIFSHFCIAAIHLPRIHFENMIPTLGGSHNSQNNFKKMTRAWTATIAKHVISFGNFQETNFSGILTAEVLKIAELTLPRSTGIRKNNASHRARGSQFQLFEHP